MSENKIINQMNVNGITYDIHDKWMPNAIGKSGQILKSNGTSLEFSDGGGSDITNLENGTGSSSVQQKFIENGVDYSAQATGKNAAAFGGKRYDMLADTDRTPTSAEGNQAFAAGGSVHAMADFTTAFGKDGIAYQKGSFVAAMKGQAGKSEEDFNTYYWDATNNVALHKGQGKKDGKITDEFGKTYNESYSTAATFGDGNKAKGYGDFAVGSGNTSDGSGNFTTGNGNVVDAVKSFTGGEANTVVGDIGNSITYGQRLKNTGRWNKATFGQFNAENKNNVLEIGGGESDSDRKNIFEVDYVGNVKAKGTATFGNGVEVKYASVNGLIWAKDYIRSNRADAYIQISSVEQAGYLEWGYGSSKNKTRLICGNYAGGAVGDNVTIIYMPNKAGTIAFQDYVVANPTLAGTEAELSGLQVGETKYKMPALGGGKLYRHVLYLNKTPYEIRAYLITADNHEYTDYNFKFTGAPITVTYRNDDGLIIGSGQGIILNELYFCAVYKTYDDSQIHFLNEQYYPHYYHSEEVTEI